MDGKLIQVADLTQQEKNKISVEIFYDAVKDILKANNLALKRVVVICTAGPARTGKSFLANMLLHYADHKEKKVDWLGSEKPINGIEWSRSEKPVTYGVWMWNKPIKIYIKGKEVFALVMDTQGLNAELQCTKMDNLLLTITLQLHDLLIYNVRECVRNSDVCLISNLLRNWPDKLRQEPIFNHLLFLYRDWSSNDNIGYQADMFKMKVLKAKADPDHSWMYQPIDKAFKNVSGFTVPYPGRAIIQASEKNNFNLKAAIEPDFIENMQKLFEMILGYEEPNGYMTTVQEQAGTGSEFLEKVKTLKGWMESEKLADKDEEMAQLYLNRKLEEIFNQWDAECRKNFEKNLEAIFKGEKAFVPADKATYEKMFVRQQANMKTQILSAQMLKGLKCRWTEKEYFAMIEKFKDFKNLDEVKDYMDNLNQASLDDENIKSSNVRLKVFASVAVVCLAGAVTASLIAFLGPFAIVGTGVFAAVAGATGAFSVSGAIASIVEIFKRKPKRNRDAKKKN